MEYFYFVSTIWYDRERRIKSWLVSRHRLRFQCEGMQHHHGHSGWLLVTWLVRWRSSVVSSNVRSALFSVSLLDDCWHDVLASVHQLEHKMVFCCSQRSVRRSTHFFSSVLFWCSNSYFYKHHSMQHYHFSLKISKSPCMWYLDMGISGKYVMRAWQ